MSSSIEILKWASPFEIYPLWAIYCKHFTEGLCFSNGSADCAMLFEIYTPSVLLLVKSTTEGVHISHGSAQWANAFEIDTPLVKCLQ